MSAEPDTIVAIATPSGRGAIGVVRVSGPATPRIAAALLAAPPVARQACLRDFIGGDGAILDRGLALYFPAPHSFTGETVLELQGHGGPVLLDELQQRVVDLGARLARPGEFTERAFLNGKLDLAQAEAVADLIDASTTAAARAAVRSLRGEFSALIHALLADLTALRTQVEASIDFSEEDIDLWSDGSLDATLSRLLAAFDAIIATARQGELLRDGLEVVIAGQPNAGKSSLINRLVGDQVAIVTAVPGTTRDILKHRIHVDGLAVNLSDTAGLRATDDPVEAEGIRRARSAMQRADRILYLVDATAAHDVAAAADVDWPPDIPVTWVTTKIDLVAGHPRIEERDGVTRLFLSSATGAGIDLLRAHLRATAGYRSAEAGALSARRRHLDALRRAREAVTRAAETLRATRALELCAEDLRLAQAALGEITGEFTSDDLLGEIFSSFCIGK